MKPVIAVLIAVLTAESASADMGVPFHSSVTVWTTVSLSEPLPEYVFFAEELPQQSEWVPITFDVNATTAVAPHGYRGTRLIAVPRAFAERFKTPDEVRKAVRDTHPAGVSSVRLPKHLDVFALDFRVSQPEREVVIRRGSDGVVFDVVKEPHASGSRWVIAGGLALTAIAILFGFRWARRRQKPV